eukprot:12410162-Karenia_brevis.AAC.1
MAAGMLLYEVAVFEGEEKIKIQRDLSSPLKRVYHKYRDKHVGDGVHGPFDVHTSVVPMLRFTSVYPHLTSWDRACKLS